MGLEDRRVGGCESWMQVRVTADGNFCFEIVSHFAYNVWLRLKRVIILFLHSSTDLITFLKTYFCKVPVATLAVHSRWVV